MPPGLAAVRTSRSGTAPPTASLSMSMSASVSEQSVAEGDTVTVSGRVSSDTCGAVVLLQRRTTGSLTWTTVDSATPSSDGRVAFTRRPSAGTYYYRLASSSRSSARAVSSPVRVKVRSACTPLGAASMSVAVPHPCVREGESVTIVGGIRDGGRGVVGAVVVLERRAGDSSRWHPVATRTSDAGGTVTFTCTPSGGGSDYRVVHPEGSTYAFAASSVVRVVVSS